MELVLVLLAPALVIGVLMVLPGIERWAVQGLPGRQTVRVRVRPVTLRAPHGPSPVHAAAPPTRKEPDDDRP